MLRKDCNSFALLCPYGVYVIFVLFWVPWKIKLIIVFIIQTVNLLHAMGLYIGFWPIPGFCRFGVLHFWWAIMQFFKILWIQTITFHDFYNLLSDFFSTYKSMYMFQKYKTNLASKELTLNTLYITPVWAQKTPISL